MEGYLEQKALEILKQALEAYGQQGTEEVILVVDGLLPPDPACCQALAQLHRGRPRVRFRSSRGGMRALLAGYGLEVEPSG
jgi:hypothetical protein